LPTPPFWLAMVKISERMGRLRRWPRQGPVRKPASREHGSESSLDLGAGLRRLSRRDLAALPVALSR
jgi:hypothetical protein